MRRYPVEAPELNLRKVIAALRYSDRIGIATVDNMNLVTNTHILLQVTDDELWEIQATFRLREVGKFYYMSNNKPDGGQCAFPPRATTLLEKAIKECNFTLADTYLYQKFGSNLSHAFANYDQYTFLDQKYIDMFTLPVMKQSKKDTLTPVLVNGKHLLTPIRTEHGLDYLKILRK